MCSGLGPACECGATGCRARRHLSDTRDPTAFSVRYGGWERGERGERGEKGEKVQRPPGAGLTNTRAGFKIGQVLQAGASPGRGPAGEGARVPPNAVDVASALVHPRQPPRTASHGAVLKGSNTDAPMHWRGACSQTYPSRDLGIARQGQVLPCLVAHHPFKATRSSPSPVATRPTHDFPFYSTIFYHRAITYPVMYRPGGRAELPGF